MEKIAVLFANLKGNLGDFAILDSMIQDLSARYKNCEIHVFHHPFFNPNYNLIRDNFGQNPNFKLINNYPKISISKLQLILLKLDPSKLFARHLVKKYAMQVENFLKPFAPYRGVYFCGGDQWCGLLLSISMFGSIVAAQTVSEKIFSFPFSVKANLGRYHNKRQLSEYFNSMNGPLPVRDQATSSILNALNVPNKFTNDSVLKKWPTLKKLPTLSANKSEATLKSQILFIVKGNPRIVPEIFKVLKNSKFEVHLLSTSRSEDEDFCSEIQNKFGYTTIYPTSWDDAVRVIAKYDLVISNRLHGLIFATLAGRAILPIADRNKTLAFTKDYGVRTFVCSIFDLKINHIEDSLGQVAKINLDEF